LKGPTVSSVRKCAGSWFHAFGPATPNAREPKCVAEELTTRSPREADRSLCLLPTDVTGRQRSAIYGVTPIISGTRKATNFKFSIFTGFWEKSERGRVQGLRKFREYPLLSQERVKLRISNFVRTFLVSIGTNAHYKFREK